MKKALLIALLILTIGFQLQVESASVRIKDIGTILEQRENQLVGFGVVIGLRNTGDSKNVAYTNEAMANLLKKMGVASDGGSFYSRNVAAVMVTSVLPSYIRKGQKVSVTVSSIGDASSLVGGTLLLTELKGPDLKTYAVAQGDVLVGGISAKVGNTTLIQNQTTVGRIPNGGIVEAEIPVTQSDPQHITVVLNQSSFTTATKVAKAIHAYGFSGAYAADPVTIKVPLAGLDRSDIVDLVAQIEEIRVEPESMAKVVINARTGTIIIGEMVRLLPVAVTHGDISVQISAPRSTKTLGGPSSRSETSITEPNARLVHLEPDATLNSLVKALNRIGASPKDLISIIQALQQSGALIATVEII